MRKNQRSACVTIAVVVKLIKPVQADNCLLPLARQLCIIHRSYVNNVSCDRSIAITGRCNRKVTERSIGDTAEWIKGQTQIGT